MRSEALKAMGIRTLRFSNLDVLKETEGVGEAIWGEVQRLTASERAAPSPVLSPAGAGRGKFTATSNIPAGVRELRSSGALPLHAAGHPSRLFGCRTSVPRTMKTTISARLVAWSPNRSRCFAVNMSAVARRMLRASSIMITTRSLNILW